MLTCECRKKSWDPFDKRISVLKAWKHLFAIATRERRHMEGITASQLPSVLISDFLSNRCISL